MWHPRRFGLRTLKEAVMEKRAARNCIRPFGPSVTSVRSKFHFAASLLFEALLFEALR
jgi:hypothetical protein